jgi:hypothetical protein
LIKLVAACVNKHTASVRSVDLAILIEIYLKGMTVLPSSDS